MTTTDLEFLKRLCRDPLLLDHEAACGAVLTADDEPAARPARRPCAPVDLAALAERLLAEMPLPDGDDGPGGVL